MVDPFWSPSSANLAVSGAILGPKSRQLGPPRGLRELERGSNFSSFFRKWPQDGPGGGGTPWDRGDLDRFWSKFTQNFDRLWIEIRQNLNRFWIKFRTDIHASTWPRSKPNHPASYPATWLTSHLAKSHQTTQPPSQSTTQSSSLRKRALRRPRRGREAREFRELKRGTAS